MNHAGPMTWHDALLDRYYRRVPGWTDGTTEFHELCAAHMPPEAAVLEIGPGPSNPTSRFLARHASRLDGLDVDAEATENDALTSVHIDPQGVSPADDDTYDTAVSNFVVEHVQDPRAHLEEIRRVLKPGGRYIFRTPNLYHYVAGVSALTPQWFHRLVANRLRGLPANAHEPWPTTYSMNTRRAVRDHARRAGFTIDHLEAVEKEPSYLAIARPLFLAGVAYERVVNAHPGLSDLRSTLFVVLRKPRPSRTAPHPQ